MSFQVPDYGEEQLTQPSLDGDMSEPQGLTMHHLLGLMYELDYRIGEIRPAGNNGPITIYLGGDAAGVFNGARNRSANGLCVFAATPPESSLISQVASSIEAGSELKMHLSDQNLQDAMDEVPQIVQRLVVDAASIEPIYSSPNIKVIVPRWEIPYAIKMHELAFDNHEDRALRWLPQFLLCYLLATTTGPSQGYLLESSVQGHVRALHLEEKRLIHRSTFDKVNRKYKERFNIEPILFEE
ncbi:hypothetical protein INS49_011816 [Diaporthe citri]|uniref:uncharacterized protein n=1 Tax=Diaporthe citri TaxID=83186 RepID=UPI001C8021C5|nr:uncharacterized protein INS49_011816 [Diaporthe citri]KAG6360750.1 hypothetical protein INS49_011816 [Diaporthe citri]